MNRLLITIYILSLGFLAIPSQAHTQRTGSIRGKVRAKDGPEISGVKVTAKEVKTRHLVMATTNDSGDFEIRSLAEGIYTLTFEKDGFQKGKKSNVRVWANRTTESNHFEMIFHISSINMHGTPVLWRDPGDISSRDLYLGPGGKEIKPDITDLTFLEADNTGYSGGFRVRDGNGKIWVAKFGKEAQPETAASRLLWAIGYVTEIHYLFPCVKIKGAPEPSKPAPRCQGGGYENVRFEARLEGIKRLGEWSWTSNPFQGTKEFKGLIVMMALINNWDLKDSNNKIIYVPSSISGSGDELHYILSDLGASFGKTGGFLTHNRNAPTDYVKRKFVTGVEGNTVKFGYSGKNSGLMKGITIEDAKWIGGLLSKLTDKQLQDAFRAANFSAEETQLLAGAVRARINQLVNVSGQKSAFNTKQSYIVGGQVRALRCYMHKHALCKAHRSAPNIKLGGWEDLSNLHTLFSLSPFLRHPC